MPLRWRDETLGLLTDLGVATKLVQERVRAAQTLIIETNHDEKLRERALQWPPERVAQVCGTTADEVRGLARDYGTLAPAAIRGSRRGRARSPSAGARHRRRT